MTAMRHRGELRKSDLDFSIWRFILGIFYLIALVMFRVGMPQIAPKYGFYTKNLEHISDLVGIACTFQTTVFLIYVAISYTAQRKTLNISFVVLTLVGSIICLYSLSKIQNEETGNQLEVLEFTKAYINRHGKIPLFLQRAQLSDASCCGIVGFKDYRAFLYKSGMQIKEDVPFSCCHDSRQGRDNKCQPYMNSSAADDVENGLTGIFIRHHDDLELEINEENLEKLYDIWRGKDGTGESSSIAHTDSQLLLPVNSSQLGNYNTKGCYEILIEQTTTLYQIYFYFLIFITFTSWIFILNFLTQHGGKLVNSCSINLYDKSGIQSKKKLQGKFSNRNRRKKGKERQNYSEKYY